MGKSRKKNTDRKRKISLVFDEVKRKDFLCGFRKRKLERKKKAQEEIQRMLKEEKRRIKQENKESYKKLVVSSRPIPDIEQLLQEEYEDEDVNVKIVELSSDTLQKKDIVIGENRPKVTIQKKPDKKIENESNEIPGMNTHEDSNADEADSDIEDKDLKSKKEVKKILKKQATKKLQKSKVYQMKSKLDKVQNRKTQKKKVKNDQRKEKSKKKNHRKKNNKPPGRNN
ncbi:nucleolar protein 12 [Pararge aegeria]|uniref:Nucleolar protein 12 n=3 Tax=Pararge aegeria TaxID=116150 RepID=A0A8S4R685_9NEOP|nr:nucleolar protein 12 [Pararge aegeria]CAH2231988.1 jg4049 [Pararge aegeria aegeria]